MAQKYEILHETGWNEETNEPEYERLTTFKNERAAVDFAIDLNNVRKYGNMLIRMKSNGNVWTYNENTGEWV